MTEWLPVLGVLIAQAFLLLVFVLKQRADDRRRWHERRVDVYLQFLRNVDLMLRTLVNDVSGWKSEEEREAAKKVWGRAMPDIDDASLELELLASRKVSATAYELTWWLAENIRMTADDPPGEQSEPWYATAKIRTLRDDLLDEIRGELGVGAPLRPEPRWWRLVGR